MGRSRYVLPLHHQWRLRDRIQGFRAGWSLAAAADRAGQHLRDPDAESDAIDQADSARSHDSERADTSARAEYERGAAASDTEISDGNAGYPSAARGHGGLAHYASFRTGAATGRATAGNTVVPPWLEFYERRRVTRGIFI